MRGNLLRAISHDLRTPLTSIYGSSSTLISKYDALPKFCAA
jgi:two-component system sensor histidine kinase KdpD